MTDDVTVGVGLSRLVKADELLRERAFNRSVFLNPRRRAPDWTKQGVRLMTKEPIPITIQ
jgi:hypothetical protein